ncbi:MAG: hypothetical protein HKN29_01575 [Rhodothermales bacterium]|nr:hypothetical protein [Rhodothermales bacterium]
MKTAANLILAVIAGMVAGSLVNIAIVNLGPLVIPLPEGADASNMETLAETMHLFRPVNFLTPFLAHALGTLVGAFVTAKIARTHRLAAALGISALFLLGGISAVVALGGPMWFKVLDLVVAYIPMGYLGARLAGVKYPAGSAD